MFASASPVRMTHGTRAGTDQRVAAAGIAARDAQLTRAAAPLGRVAQAGAPRDPAAGAPPARAPRAHARAPPPPAGASGVPRPARRRCLASPRSWLLPCSTVSTTYTAQRRVLGDGGRRGVARPAACATGARRTDDPLAAGVSSVDRGGCFASRALMASTPGVCGTVNASGLHAAARELRGAADRPRER